VIITTIIIIIIIIIIVPSLPCLPENLSFTPEILHYVLIGGSEAMHIVGRI
jgi:hypothetical protein